MRVFSLSSRYLHSLLSNKSFYLHHGTDYRILATVLIIMVPASKPDDCKLGALLIPRPNRKFRSCLLWHGAYPRTFQIVFSMVNNTTLPYMLYTVGAFAEPRCSFMASWPMVKLYTGVPFANILSYGALADDQHALWYNVAFLHNCSADRSRHTPSDF